MFDGFCQASGKRPLRRKAATGLVQATGRT
jgi:hypothetical protein